MNTHPFIIQRLWEIHKHPAELDAYLALLKRQRGACDEVWDADVLCNSTHHEKFCCSI